MGISAMISLTDSTAVNLLVKGETDVARFALDTGWQMIIGNAETQIDLLSLGFFERKAKETGNAKLKLLGYAVVVTSQSLGYLGYSKVTRAYEERHEGSETSAQEKPEIRLVPVLQ
jgi:hypothetical protein